MMALKATDIARVPPHDTDGQMMDAATLLKRWRKNLTEGDLSVEWQRWILESLLAGLLEKQEGGTS